MRILVTACGGEGHLGPLLPFVSAARDRGDDVLLVVPPAQEDTARATGCRYETTGSPDKELKSRIHRDLQSGDREVRVRAAEVELFGRLLTDAALPTMHSAAETFRPDLVLREPCDYASAIVAHRMDIPVTTVGISPGRADISGLKLASEVIEPIQPGTRKYVEAAPYLTRFPIDDATGYPDTRRYGFRVACDRSTSTSTPVVWLTFGTVNTAFEQIEGTWTAALEALGSLDVQVVASVGRGGRRYPAPPNVEVVDWVEASDILGRASAVVCHGGSGTTLSALAAGVPVVTVPMLADQPANASMVESLGAGITVAPKAGTKIQGLTSDDVPRLRAAVEDVLEDRRYRTAAKRVADLYATLPTVAEALDSVG
ncbi:glycosyltransferase [Rhodococcoides kyotonense]|uniref:UDP:flavonoid glycosyltransferase YjiC, YdhE family n=1 Tax=Rhodococcoides kyotonense TaxID=398843 RepID=A0A239KJ50_9NOCA|nr:glycosyltransferase [Rhodococcus kyotonensis]SNT17643.1 UDP:flavonoid glycosyltransferase YjiC, YdhE family [Rhodococcus kyotonensis]